MKVNEDGSPSLDKDGGMWIKLTVCGITRLGYGDAESKTGPNATKERIGDALRNAAMRFGAALDLWHKGELHAEEPEEPITLEQATALVEHLNFCDVKAEVFCAGANIRSVSELLESRYQGAYEWITRRGEMMAKKREELAGAEGSLKGKLTPDNTRSTFTK